MRIVMVVNDAYRADEGIYFCKASYMDGDDLETTVYKVQYVTNESKLFFVVVFNRKYS